MARPTPSSCPPALLAVGDQHCAPARATLSVVGTRPAGFVDILADAEIIPAVSRAPARADVFQAIADSTRRRILDRLCEGESPVGDLVAATEGSYSSVSQHLAILRQAGLVVGRAAGRQRVYRVNAEALRDVFEWSVRYQHFWRSRLKSLRQYLEDRS